MSAGKEKKLVAEEGLLADHVDGHLDPRIVVKAIDGQVWLRGPSGKPMGPFPEENYTYSEVR